MVVFDIFLLSFCQQIASFCYKASKRKYVYAHKRIDVKFYIASGIYLLHLEILSKASAVRSCVPKAVKRTYPSPLGPKPQPGVQTTCAP